VSGDGGGLAFAGERKRAEALDFDVLPIPVVLPMDRKDVEIINSNV